MDLPAVVAVGGAGLLSGAVNSIAGGGSLLLFPALLGVELPTLTANVTNSVANWPGWVGQVYGFADDLKAQSRRRLVLLSVATGLGTIVGSVLLLATTSATFNLVVPVLVLFASLLMAGQRRVKKLVRPPDKATSSGARRPWAGLAVVMAAAGVYGGYFGGAMGVIMLVALALATTDGLRRLNALKAALSLVDSTISLLIFALWGRSIGWRWRSPPQPP
ncbi:sulfite exporter TauE/SafE family protein [Streptomyces sp. NPDC056669]|uniref:sulfite exporter TauE/SafE family protein n=1 Tax=Streptomyces sp. NPDC056669 TaxID=3345903 RepID=UPI00367B4CDD